MGTAPVLAFTWLALPFAAQLIAAQAGQIRFGDMDRNNDGVITRAEWRGSERSFRVHDWNSDGILSGDEVRLGASRPGSDPNDQSGIWDDREDTFENLDVNRNDRLERAEWHGSDDAFKWLDRNNDGVLSRGEVVGRGSGRGVVSRSRQNRRDPAMAAGTGQKQECEPNAARVVDDIYQQVLERSADQASAGMTQALAAGRMTVRDIVAQLAKSPEHAEQSFWKPAVTTLYRRQLGREPDPEGLRSFTELARRDGLDAVERAILASPEFQQRGRPAGPSGSFTEEYEAAVRSLYRHLLGRDPDPAGLRDLTQIGMARGFDAVVDRMLSSREYQQLYGDDVVPGRGVRYCGPTP